MGVRTEIKLTNSTVSISCDGDATAELTKALENGKKVFSCSDLQGGTGKNFLAVDQIVSWRVVDYEK